LNNESVKITIALNLHKFDSNLERKLLLRVI